jgi:threonyl-tRNA synthetase
VMIHSAKFGSIERFFGVLTEHYAGAFPAWLAPVQVMCIPIRSENVDYLRGVVERLQGEGVRAEVDESDDRMQKKILRAQQHKVPFMFVAGPRDVEAGAISMRYRNGVERRGVPIDDAIVEVARNIASRQVEPDALNPETVVA